MDLFSPRSVDPRIVIALVTILILGMLLALAGCVPAESSRAPHQIYMTVDGCRVFEIEDPIGRYHYITTCTRPDGTQTRKVPLKCDAREHEHGR